MLSTKFITLGLSVLLLSSSVFAKTGAETGGGGDAVVINGKLVIRDVIAQKSVSIIENNIEFLQSVKGFKTLIESIAKVNPEFASSIILDLSNVKFYLSASDLPLLPYTQTTMAGEVAADVQLASRTGDDVILAPQFLENDYTNYTLIHESLHGLLKNNAGPAHHQRVRNIVKYLYANQGSLTAEGLNEVLKKNNYAEFGARKDKYVWDKNLDSTVKCYFALDGQMSKVGLFAKVDCGNTDLLEKAAEITNFDYYNVFAQRNALVEARFPEIKIVFYASLVSTNDVPGVRSFTLQKDSIFNSRVTIAQKSVCWENAYTKRDLLKLKTKSDLEVSQLEKLNKDLDSASLSTEVKEALVRSYAGYSKETLAQMLETTKTANLLINESITKAQKNEANCQSQYPN